MTLIFYSYFKIGMELLKGHGGENFPELLLCYLWSIKTHSDSEACIMQ